MEKKELLSGVRFAVWAILLTVADLIFTYVGLICITKDYEASPIVSFFIAQHGTESAFGGLFIVLTTALLLVSLFLKYRLVKIGAYALLSVKISIFILHFFSLYFGGLI